jgi:hypothetical protein
MTGSTLTPLAKSTTQRHGGSAENVVAYAELLAGRPVSVTFLDGLHATMYKPTHLNCVILGAGRILSGGNANQYAVAVKSETPARSGRSDAAPSNTVMIPVGRIIDIMTR